MHPRRAPHGFSTGHQSSRTTPIFSLHSSTPSKPTLVFLRDNRYNTSMGCLAPKEGKGTGSKAFLAGAAGVLAERLPELRRSRNYRRLRRAAMRIIKPANDEGGGGDNGRVHT